MPLFDTYVPIFRHRITRKAEMHSDTCRNWLERPFSSFELWIDLNWSHLWSCRSSLGYLRKCCPPERKMHASAKFKGRAQKKALTFAQTLITRGLVKVKTFFWHSRQWSFINFAKTFTHRECDRACSLFCHAVLNWRTCEYVVNTVWTINHNACPIKHTKAAIFNVFSLR